MTVMPLPSAGPWPTRDPFLFCVHHRDLYPQGNVAMGPAVPLTGRRLGQDFSGQDGWSMYHGRQVPGFPRHPHRGFETLTVTRTGFIDHADSLGATARYGQGDAQWMTAGKGVVHAEMFPLREQASANTTEFFQIWINLPANQKFADPHFTMFWHETIPVHRVTDNKGHEVTITTIAGSLLGTTPPAPPPASWASAEGSEVAVWTIDLARGASWTLPAGSSGLNRSLYVVRGDHLTVAGARVASGHRADLDSASPATLLAGDTPAELLLLQGKPIGEPVARHGPFVMNTRQEIHEAYRDYQQTGFGGWPWDRDDPVHPRAKGRFAVHIDGRRDAPT